MPPASCPSGRSIRRPAPVLPARTAAQRSVERPGRLPPPKRRKGFPRTRKFSPLVSVRRRPWTVFRERACSPRRGRGRTSAHCGAAFGFPRDAYVRRAAAGAHVRPLRRCIRFSARRVCSPRRSRGARPSIAALYPVFRATRMFVAPRQGRTSIHRGVVFGFPRTRMLAAPQQGRTSVHRDAASGFPRTRMYVRAAAGAHVCLSRRCIRFPANAHARRAAAGAHVRPSRRCIRFSA